MVTAAALVDGLPIRMNRSKNDPVEPSAMNHCSAGAVMPALAVPPANVCPPDVMYIARSAKIGWSTSMRAETSVASRPGSWSTYMVRRLFGSSG
jgi:hypothetical protein